MSDNPILEIWKQTVESGGDLASARKDVATRAQSGQISSDHIIEVGTFLESDEVKTSLPEDALILTATLLFQATQSHPSLNNRLRFAASIILWKVIPHRRRDLLRLNLEAAKAALSLAPEDFPEQRKASLLGDMGISLHQLGDHRAALSYLQEALQFCRRLSETDPATFEPEMATILNNLGNLFRTLGDRAGAREKLEEALQIRRRLAQAQPAAFEPDMAGTLNNLGVLLSDLGDRAGAREKFEEALKIKRQLAQTHPAAFEPDMAMTLNNLGVLLSDLGDKAGARENYEEALEIKRRLAQTRPAAFEPDVAGTLNNLGNLLRELGDGARAREAFEEALPLATRGEPLLPPMIMTNLGVLLYEEGQDKKGMGLAWKAVRQIERMLSDPHYAEVRYSFKGEIEDAYRLVLCDPELERDTPRARRLLEAMRVGEALGELRHEDAPHFLIDEALEGEHGTVLTIQRIHDGLLFLATLRTETIFERTDASWIEAGKKLLEEVQSQEALKQGGTERIAAAGHELWKTLPASVQRLLPEDSSSGIALSLDPEVGVLPLEFLTPTGKPEDFLCLKMEMPRVPGERLFRQCQERNVIDGAGEYCTLVFGNPTKDLKYAQSEALTIASHLSKNGFRPAFGDKETLIGDDAKMPKFLEALEAHPTIVHYSGHGSTLNQEECLVFADNGLLFSDALLKHVEPFSNHPFVFLSSCLSGRARAYGGAFRGLPIAFLRLGAAAVVASVFPLADKPAASFATIFYEELLDGQTVGEAILQTRQAMFVQGINCLHWGRPILYGNPHARLVLPSR